LFTGSMVHLINSMNYGTHKVPAIKMDKINVQIEKINTIARHQGVNYLLYQGTKIHRINA
jgi:hypothetical protein